MKLYDCQTAPSPRRVRIFLAEKGIEIPMVAVDLRNNEHLAAPFRTINPWCTVPVLQLDDGTSISECAAICGYLEELHAEPPLLGRDAKERAIVAMWDRRCELDGCYAVAEMLRNKARGMKARALTGPHDVEQIPALVERGSARVQHFFEALDQRLADHDYLAGECFTMADITALISVDFAGWVKLTLSDELVHAKRWHQAVSARPSAKA
jgi:glutathione S-transferase